MVRLALVSSLTICPQCGDDWGEARDGGRLRGDFCPRCGSPVAGMLGFDPFVASLLAPRAAGAMRSGRGTRLIVVSGVLLLATVAVFSGLLLTYGGWFSPAGAGDAVQTWFSRLGGPVLVLQGLAYGWLPFRRRVAPAAKIIQFPSR